MSLQYIIMNTNCVIKLWFLIETSIIECKQYNMHIYNYMNNNISDELLFVVEGSTAEMLKKSTAFINSLR